MIPARMFFPRIFAFPRIILIIKMTSPINPASPNPTAEKRAREIKDILVERRGEL